MVTFPFIEKAPFIFEISMVFPLFIIGVTINKIIRAYEINNIVITSIFLLNDKSLCCNTIPYIPKNELKYRRYS